MGTFLTLQNVCFAYKKSSGYVLNGIDLEIKEGEYFVLLGANGMGKSTLCYCLNGLIPHSIKGKYSGKVIVDGVDVLQSSVAEMTPLVSMIFQDFESQLFSTNVKLELAFGPENLGYSPEKINKRVNQVIGKVGLEGMENRQPAYLSGGEKQRLAIGSVLTIDPKMLVLDEPTTDLDPQARTKIFHILDKLRHEQKRTLFVVEHDVEEVLSADRIGIMKNGKLVSIGSPGDIFANCVQTRKMGIQPPQLLEITQSLNIRNGLLSPIETCNQLNRLGFHLNEKKYGELVQKDSSREKKYGSPVIEIYHLKFSYEPGALVLKDVSLTIRAGEFVALVGQNGSGKTTLAKHVKNLLKPSSGEIRICGKSIGCYSNLELSQLVGYVFQNPDHQIFARTVKEEVGFSPKLAGVKGCELEDRINTALQSVGLLDEAEEDPFLLTKGGRQRVAVASLLAAECEIMIFDEPTTGLDYMEICNMMNLVKKLNEKGKTVIIITHNMNVVAEFAHRMVVMKKGEIVTDKPTRKAFANEQLLGELGLKPPPVLTLGNLMSRPVLTVEEFLSIIEKP